MMIQWDKVSTTEILFIAVMLVSVAAIVGTGLEWAMLR